MHDEHSIPDLPLRIAHGLPERPVMQSKHGQDFARRKPEILDDEIAVSGSQ
jgi:hypothetical protein